MDVKKTGNKLVLTMDLEDIKTAPQSKSGKSKIAYSTGGFTRYENVKIAVNVIY